MLESRAVVLEHVIDRAAYPMPAKQLQDQATTTIQDATKEADVWTKAKAAYDAGQWESAIELFEKAVAEAPDHANADMEQAVFGIAYAKHRGVMGMAPGDQRKQLLEAQDQYRKYIQSYPQGQFVNQAKKGVTEIEDTLAAM